MRQISVRVEPEVHEALWYAAKERDIPLQRLVTALLVEGLDRLVPADEWRLTR